MIEKRIGGKKGLTIKEGCIYLTEKPKMLWKICTIHGTLFDSAECPICKINKKKR